MNKICGKLKDEKGNITIAFAAMLVVLLFFAGICVDLGMVYLRRAELYNLSKIIREERITFQDAIRYSDNPGAKTYEVVENALIKNNYNGNLKVYFQEYVQQENLRQYRTKVVLSKEVPYNFLRIFGHSSVTLNVSIDGSDTMGETSVANVVVWHPSADKSSYSGSYERTGSAIDFDDSDLPDSW